MVAPAKAGKFTFYWAASQGLAAEWPTHPTSPPVELPKAAIF